MWTSSAKFANWDFMALCCCFPAEDDDTKEAPSSKKRSPAVGNKGKPATEKPKAPKTKWQKIDKFLFGWASSTFKINGKKLMPHNAVLWRFMVSMLSMQHWLYIQYYLGYI